MERRPRRMPHWCRLTARCFSIAQGQRVFSYDKIHLVPFGEYEPFPLIHEVVNRVSDEVGGFRKGQTYGVGSLPGGYSLGVFICYEAIYPGEVRRFAADGATLLVNISNDGWFGRSAAARATSIDGARARGGKSPMAAARDQ